MKVLKFGGQSLTNGRGIENVISIIKELQASSRLVVVVSARGKTTDQLEQLLEKAKAGITYLPQLEALQKYLSTPVPEIDFSVEFDLLQKRLEGVEILGDYSLRLKDEILAQGELIAAKTLSCLLRKEGFETEFVDSRTLIKTDDRYGDASLIPAITEKNVKAYFKKTPPVAIQVVTGFIASAEDGATTTLGRNGSNYTASLLAHYLGVKEFRNYTHVSGIHTADPSLVEDARPVHRLSYNEANELANFGTSILHSKTILPLIEKRIPLRILNTFYPKSRGTLISERSGKKEIKTISTANDICMIRLSGNVFWGQSGIQARIFNALDKHGIDIKIISQGSTGKGVGLIISSQYAALTKEALEKEFAYELESREIKKIALNFNVAIIAAVGHNLKKLHFAFSALIEHNIVPLLINNSFSGTNLSMVINKRHLKKAVNLVHNQVFNSTVKAEVAYLA